ncbi:MAG TPA: hypothetical protein VLI67_10015 [Vicinamibacteria bacterium]|nr:hypothetical protein [Vicinamibacteria bacterium]
MGKTRHTRVLSVFLVATVALIVGATGPDAWAATKKLAISRIYFEYNASANDLGVHVFLDGEDWRTLRIVNPAGTTIFTVEGKGPYAQLGLTELFFEGAEPTLGDGPDEVPLEDLLAKFPKGKYKFSGKTVEGNDITGTGTLSHAIPAGPSLHLPVSVVGGDTLIISWDEVTGRPNDDFPDEPINILGYQVIVGTFQVTVPATTTSVTVTPEFVGSLPSGTHAFEVLAIEASGNQSISEGSFTKP